jgi:hypothetical protein
MELYERLEQILGELRPAFSREATFRWFVLLLDFGQDRGSKGMNAIDGRDNDGSTVKTHHHPPFIMPIPLTESDLKSFREQLYNKFEHRSDSAMDLLDAVCSNNNTSIGLWTI